METKTMNSPMSKCPTDNKAVSINVKPSILSELTGCSKIESSWRPGNHIFTNYLTYKLALDSLNQIENRFGYGVTYSRNKDIAPENAGDGGINTVSKPTFCTYLETNMINDISYKLCHNVFCNLWGHISGNVLDNWTKSKISGSIELANDNLNVQVSADEATDTSNELNINFTKQIFSSCVIGGQCTFIKDKKSPIPIMLKGYEGILGYRQGYMSYSATLNQSLSTALRAVARYDSNSTSLEINCEYEKSEIKCLLSQETVVTKNIEVKGDSLYYYKVGAFLRRI
ncbi:Hypothetical protein CINCED_3A000381 [Cinara cedri]|uniref:Eukaryotic porin/Tom40 n=1 Tax=Cinara cedri TaxID=506608 RepID=A0A5E4M1W2_9HEMI|nr:Hypothetical protein CINCED_3A000381 [Cinara cedri]